MADTGADVTIIPRSEWPWDWKLTPANGVILGIGGAAVSMHSKDSIIVEGPEGQVATIRPFVVRSGITSWGRDLLSQWGDRPEIPKPPRDF